jgi:hypothetical protein
MYSLFYLFRYSFIYLCIYLFNFIMYHILCIYAFIIFALKILLSLGQYAFIIIAQIITTAYYHNKNNVY